MTDAIRGEASERVSDHHCPTGWHAVPQVWCRIKHDCRCDGCVQDYRTHWRRKMHRLRGYSDRGLGDADATRAQLRMLVEAGMPRAEIARTVGCHRKTIEWTLLADRRVSARVRRAVDRLWRETFAPADSLRSTD